MQASSRAPWKSAVAVLVAYLIVGLISQALAWNAWEDSETTPVWLAAGVVFGALCVMPPARWAPVILASFIAAVAWGLYGHDLHPASVLVFAAIEIGFVVLGAWVATRLVPEGNPLAALAALLAGAVLTAALGASVAAGFWIWVRPTTSYGLEWRTWASSTALGILLVAPLVTAFRDFEVRRSGGLSMARFWAGAVAFAVFLVIAWVVFGKDVAERIGRTAATLAYLPMPFLVLAALIWGAQGGAIATLIGALLVVGRTASGGGPFALADSSLNEAVIQAQVYVAVWTLLLLLLRALTEQRRQALVSARAWQLRYERALQASHVASAEVDARTGRISWGQDAGAVLGSAATSIGNITDWLARVEPDGRPLAETAWAAARGGEHRDAGDDYAMQLGGRRLPMRVSWSPVVGPDDAVELVVGLLRVVQAPATQGLEALDA